MSINVLHMNEVSNGLEVVQGDLGIKVNNTGNVQFTVSAEGLKGDVEIPASPVALADADYVAEGNKLVFTHTDGSAAKEVALPAPAVDIHVSNINVTDDGKVQLTFENSETPVETNLTAKALIHVILNADDADKGLLKAFIKEMIKGEEVKNFHDEVKGFLIAA